MGVQVTAEHVEELVEASRLFAEGRTRSDRALVGFPSLEGGSGCRVAVASLSAARGRGRRVLYTGQQVRELMDGPELAPGEAEEIATELTTHLEGVVGSP